ncbi:ABC-2 family transporter protein [Pseudobythopirellula maris]|uniref:ABC-2 family transporter protein n=1 Tax=Pseudobythopirellula maris TaxID=2527991 RepID=A0A5C5ZWD1_9BACT|nr:hypothetical protein [Pseudobythopirellula maris]TWT90563.1 ABC-2 family transporter protein [Pseudobythopirellula maris]
MVVEEDILPYLTWLLRGDGASLAEGQGALVGYAIIVVVLAVLALVLGFLVSLVRHGPVKAGELTYRTLVGGVSDLLRLSWRRVTALAALAMKEAFRRRVLVSLVVFALILLFASWYLKTDKPEPAKLYLSFVLTATNYLVLLLSLLLAAFSLPTDFKSKTIYTVVTKPVRSIDIVLGRILGYIGVGTLLLAVMGAASYVFVLGSLSHTHNVDLQSLENLYDAQGNTVGKSGETSYDADHRHTLPSLSAEGEGYAEATHDHTHLIEADGDQLKVGPAEGYLRARVPLRGKIHFLSRSGVREDKGINVGNEWGYRSFIQGASAAAAIWTFSGVDDSTLVEYEDGGQYLPVELLVRVYRSYKGDIERAIQGSIQLRNPDTGLKTSIRIFPSKDDQFDRFDFSRAQFDTEQNPIDLIDDLVSESGEIEVIVQCLDRSQYFGFAQADCYIRLPEGSPTWNFVKGFLTIWMQMVLVIVIAVTASTFLNGPIAMIFTVSFILIGFQREFFLEVARGSAYGGGPVEALVRLVTHMNLMIPFDPSFAVSLMKGVDTVLQTFMLAVSSVLPDFSSYLNRINYVADGYSIPSDLFFRDLTICLAYLAGATVVGLFCFRTREVAK